MTGKLTALLGLHNRLLGESLSDIFARMGYHVDLVSSVEEMLAKIGQREYRAYMMDFNLGMVNSPDITPAITTYEAIRPQIEAGRAKFLGRSGNEQAVQAAQERGSPVAPGQSPLGDLEYLEDIFRVTK